MYNLVRFSIKSLRTTKTALVAISKKLRAKGEDEIEMVALSYQIDKNVAGLIILEKELIKLREKEK